MQRQITVVVASVVLIGSVVVLWRTIRSTPDQFDPAPFVGVGQVLAEEATQAVHDQGRLVAVLTAAHQERGSSPNLEWEAFRTELKKHPAVHRFLYELTGLALAPNEGVDSGGGHRQDPRPG